MGLKTSLGIISIWFEKENPLLKEDNERREWGRVMRRERWGKGKRRTLLLPTGTGTSFFPGSAPFCMQRLQQQREAEGKSQRSGQSWRKDLRLVLRSEGHRALEKKQVAAGRSGSVWQWHKPMGMKGQPWFWDVASLDCPLHLRTLPCNDKPGKKKS